MLLSVLSYRTHQGFARQVWLAVTRTWNSVHVLVWRWHKLGHRKGGAFCFSLPSIRTCRHIGLDQVLVATRDGCVENWDMEGGQMEWQMAPVELDDGSLDDIKGVGVLRSATGRCCVLAWCCGVVSAYCCWISLRTSFSWAPENVLTLILSLPFPQDTCKYIDPTVVNDVYCIYHAWKYIE
jgi:hypothetical protein